MECSKLTSNMWYQTATSFAATPDTVYETLWKAPDRAHPGVETNVLERLTIAGTPGHEGHMQQLRCVYGGLDLFVVETVLIADRPHCYEVKQLPDGLQRHDPAEREVKFLDSMVDDLDAKFLADFGDPPLATRIRIDLAPTQDGCDATLTLSVPDADKLGAFRLWGWKRHAKKQSAIVFDQIAAAL